MALAEVAENREEGPYEDPAEWAEDAQIELISRRETLGVWPGRLAVGCRNATPCLPGAAPRCGSPGDPLA